MPVGGKKQLQQRHLRRLEAELIARQAGRKSPRPRNQKPHELKTKKGRRKKSLRAGRGKKITRKKTEFQTARIPPVSFRR